MGKEIHLTSGGDVAEKVLYGLDGVCCMGAQGGEPFSLTPNEDESMECCNDPAMHACQNPANQV